MTTPTRPSPTGDAGARALTPAHAALLYATQGWPVLPIHTPGPSGCSCRRAGCPKPGKHPRTLRGVANATSDLTRVETWWTRWPDANVAIATGRLVVLDIDGPAGRDALAALERTHGPLPATLLAHTAHGEHRYFAADKHTVGCSAAQLGPGLDVRGRGGYAIAPPSRHATGHTYRWASLDAIAGLPDWLAELLNARSFQGRAPLPVITARHTERARRYAQAALAGELDAVRTAAVGTRNTTLNRAAFRLGQLAGADLIPADQLIDPLLDAARHAGLPESEALTTIASGLSAGQRQPRSKLTH
jgi:hypothetical protein